MSLTSKQISVICPTNKNIDKLVSALNTFLPKYNITSKLEIASFLSQCGHESCDFNSLEENLNYSADALHRTWPKRFPDDATCKAYARQPIKIANKVYADRMGNGNEASGDGWKYHGRGAIQLTGFNNNKAFSDYSKVPLNELQSYLLTMDGAVESACWFWTVNKLNVFADAGDVEGLTRKINGGTIGVEDRKARYNVAIAAL
jgi:putative chitinase